MHTLLVIYPLKHPQSCKGVGFLGGFDSRKRRLGRGPRFRRQLSFQYCLEVGITIFGKKRRNNKEV